MKKLCLVLCLWIISINVIASDFQVDNVHYNILSLSDLTVEVTYPNDRRPFPMNGSTYSGNISIPSTVSYKGRDFQVVAIGEYAFWESLITSIKLPTGLTKIGYSAFYKCEKLNSVILPETVSELDKNAFLDCTFSTFTIPKSMKVLQMKSLPIVRGEMRIEDSDEKLFIMQSYMNAKQLYIGRPMIVQHPLTKVLNIGLLTNLTLGKCVSNASIFLLGKTPTEITITINSETPPALNGQPQNELLLNATLRVPQKALEAYKGAPNWKDFFSIEGF